MLIENNNYFFIHLASLFLETAEFINRIYKYVCTVVKNVAKLNTQYFLRAKPENSECSVGLGLLYPFISPKEITTSILK